MIHPSFVWIGYQRVTEGQTDGQTDIRNCCRYYSAMHCKQCGRAVKTERIKTDEMTRGPECHQWSHCAKALIKSVYCNSQALKKQESSPERQPNLRRSSLRNSKDEGLKAPKFSVVMGWNMWSDYKLWYYSAFRSAAISATDPTPVAALSTWNWANVLTPVTSQTNGLPPCHGIRVSPSGRWPSCLLKSERSLMAGIPAELRVRQLMSLITWCLAFLHTDVWRPCASTLLQQGNFLLVLLLLVGAAEKQSYLKRSVQLLSVCSYYTSSQLFNHTTLLTLAGERAARVLLTISLVFKKNAFTRNGCSWCPYVAGCQFFQYWMSTKQQ